MILPNATAILDLESTGPNPDSDRIVQIGLVLIGRADSGIGHLVPEERSRLVNPGIPIPAAATAVHGVTDDDVRAEAPFSRLAKSLVETLAGRDLVGFGISRFDVPLLMAEFRRVGIEWEPDGVVIDCMRIFHHFHPRDLTAALKQYCEADHVDAHDAAADCWAALRVFEAQIHAHGLDPDPESLAAIGLDENAVDPYGKLVKIDGEVCLSFGKHRGVPVWQLPSGYLSWMDGKFPATVMRLIGDAIMDHECQVVSDTDTRLMAYKRRGYVFHAYNDRFSESIYCEVEVADGYVICGEGATVASAVTDAERKVRDFEARRR